MAAIDCGTNSIRLLVAEVDLDAGTLVDLDRRMEIVRLGQGVDRTGRIAPEALARTIDAAHRYAEICADLGVEAVRFVATSATRDAENRQDFVAGVQTALGVSPEVIDGQQEAALSFRGATGVLAAAHPGPYLVVDLGGGSTELVLGGAEVEAAYSMDVGCVRMFERHLTGDPPSASAVDAARRDVVAALDVAARHVPLGRTRTLVGVAGTVTTVTAHALGLETYDPERIDGAALPADTVLTSATDLLRMPRARRAELGFMHPGRVDVIGAGALVWAEVVRRVQAEVAAAGGSVHRVVSSEHDILDGIAWSAAERALAR